MHDAELRSTLNECRLGLEDGRKGLVEIGRHLAEIATVGLRWQPERNADLVNFGQRLDELRTSRRQLRLALVVHLARHIVPADELPCSIELKLRQHQCGLALVDRGDARVQQSDLAVDAFHGALQIPALAHRLRFDRARRRGGCLQVGFRGVHRRLLLGEDNAVWLLVQRGDEIAFAHTIVVIDQNAGNLSWHAGRDKRYVSIDVCIVRGDGVQHRLDPRDAEHEDTHQDGNTEGAGHEFSLGRRPAGLLRWLRGIRVMGSRSLFIRRRLRIGRARLVTLLRHVGHPLQRDHTDGVERPPRVLIRRRPWPPVGGGAFRRKSSKAHLMLGVPFSSGRKSPQYHCLPPHGS